MSELRLKPGDVIEYSEDAPTCPQWSRRWKVVEVGAESPYPTVDRYNVLLESMINHHGRKLEIGMSAPHRSLQRQLRHGYIRILTTSPVDQKNL